MDRIDRSLCQDVREPLLFLCHELDLESKLSRFVNNLDLWEEVGFHVELTQIVTVGAAWVQQTELDTERKVFQCVRWHQATQSLLISDVVVYVVDVTDQPHRTVLVLQLLVT